MKKVEAFTVTELLLVMIITGLVIFFASFALMIFFEFELRGRKDYNKKQNLGIFCATVTDLSFKSDYLTTYNQRQIIFRNTKILGSIEFGQDTVVLMDKYYQPFTGVSIKNYSIKTEYSKNGDLLVSEFSITLDQIKEPLKIKKLIPESVRLNENIDRSL